MSEAATLKFGCPNCARQFVWKEQLAGKKAKCKCGNVIQVPLSMTEEPPAEEPLLRDMIDFVEDDDPPPPAKVVKVAKAPVPVLASAGPKKLAKPAGAARAVPLGYKSAPTKRDKDRFSQANLMDMPRDVYVPVALLASGFLIYAAYFSTSFHLNSRVLPFVLFGVGLLTVLKTALLIAFAFVIAGPTGVSFGGLWTAILKLAAVAVFCDGVVSWVDLAVQRVSGVRTVSPLGLGFIGFPVALLTYWLLYQYLFTMDSSESWIIVRFLFIFDRLVRWGLFLTLLGLFANIGPHGAGHAASAGAGLANAPAAASSDPLSVHVQDLKDTDSLIEARKYIASGNQAVFGKPVDDWYAAGCPNVWFEMGRGDINGRRNAFDVIVELPPDKAGRQKCFDILKTYYDGVQIPTDATEMKDTGQTYLIVMMR
jgi:hypothetical protein